MNMLVVESAHIRFAALIIAWICWCRVRKAMVIDYSEKTEAITAKSSAPFVSVHDV